MTISAPLGKLTNSGFTVLPNRLVDQVLASDSSHTVDTLALALYLVRHIPGQNGALVLAGDFSQATLCQDLGWGKTNRARLKRALADLERLKVVSTELRDNNTVVLHITAELPKVGEGINPPGCKESSQPARKESARPPCENSSRPSLSRASSEFPSNINKIEHNNLHLLTKARDIPARATSVDDDDEVTRLLALYREKFGKPISPKIRDSFALSYEANDRPFKLVAEGFETLSRHPKLRADTASPNAVWELDYMLKMARKFDAWVRSSHLEEGMRRGNSVDEIKGWLVELARSSGFDSEALLAHFASDLSRIEAARAEEAARNAQWQREYESKLLETEGSASPTSASCEASNTDQPVESAIGDDRPDRDASQPTNIANSDSPPSEEASTTGAEQLHAETAAEGATSSPAIEGATVQAPAPRAPSVPPELLQARSKAELIGLIASALEGDLPEVMRQRLSVLSEFAKMEKTSFEMLSRIVRVHAREDENSTTLARAA